MNDLHTQGTYGSLTLVHIPGVSVYDEEIRLPSGEPKPKHLSSCPELHGSVLAAQWKQLGYSDQNLESGLTPTIVEDTAQAFPAKSTRPQFVPALGLRLGGGFP